MSTTATRYDHLTREQLVALLEKQQREKKLGLVWERDSIEPDREVNNDFVAMTLDGELSAGYTPYQNLLIEGDNYDVLRYLHLAYRGQVKVIYIDPPYNTGNGDFIYNDRFVDKEHRYRHSVWLEFMARRLELARDLLADDGVIFVSISDHEHARLVMLMDEIFPGMRVGSFVWRTRSGANDEKGRFFSVDHEYIVAYANPGFSFGGVKKALADYRNPDDDPRGKWVSGDLTKAHSLAQRPETFYTVHNPETDIYYPCDPNRVWAYATQERVKPGQRLRSMTMEQMIAEKRVLWKDEPEVAQYATEAELLAALKAGTAPANLNIYLDLERIKEDVRKGTAPEEVLEYIPPLSFWVGKKIGRLKPRLKKFAADLKTTERPISSWFAPNASVGKKDHKAALEELDADMITLLTAGYTSEGTKVLRQVMGNSGFQYPKPLSIIKQLIEQSTDPNEGHIVLDFFAGSGTTGQAVLELNQEDDGDRRFILVSSTEATEENPDKNICRDVTSRRLRNVIQGYEYPTKKGRKKVEGTGGEFAYLRSERIPVGRLHTHLKESQAWLALQQMHQLGLSPYDEERALQVLDDGFQRIVYVPEVTEETVAALEELAERDALTTRVYSPTPGLLEARVFSEHMTFARVPDAIIERFRL